MGRKRVLKISRMDYQMQPRPMPHTHLTVPRAERVGAGRGGDPEKTEKSSFEKLSPTQERERGTI